MASDARLRPPSPPAWLEADSSDSGLTRVCSADKFDAARRTHRPGILRILSHHVGVLASERLERLETGSILATRMSCRCHKTYPPHPHSAATTTTKLMMRGIPNRVFESVDSSGVQGGGAIGCGGGIDDGGESGGCDGAATTKYWHVGSCVGANVCPEYVLTLATS